MMGILFCEKCDTALHACKCRDEEEQTMSDNLKDAAESGFRIYGEKIQAPFSNEDLTDLLEAYTSRILASQQAAHEAEIAKLKEEKKAWVNKWEALKLKHDLILPVAKGLEEQLSAANAACAMLTKEIEQLKSK